MTIPNTLVIMQIARRDDIPPHIRHILRMDDPRYADKFRVVREGEDIATHWPDQVLLLADDTQLTSGYIVTVVEQLKYWLPNIPMLVLPVADEPPPPDKFQQTRDKYTKYQQVGYYGAP